MTPASGSANRTGTQSAARTARVTPGSAVTSPSPMPWRWPCTSCPGPSGPTRTTTLPWTWPISARLSTPSPGAKSSISTRWFAAIASGSSPPAQPRFSDSKGAPLTPSCRSVKASSTGPWVRREAYNSSVVQPGRLLEEVGDVEVVVVELELRTRRRGLLPGSRRDRLALLLRLGGRLTLLRGQGLGRRPGLFLRLLLMRRTTEPRLGLAALRHAAVEAGRDH